MCKMLKVSSSVIFYCPSSRPETQNKYLFTVMEHTETAQHLFFLINDWNNFFLTGANIKCKDKENNQQQAVESSSGLSSLYNEKHRMYDFWCFVLTLGHSVHFYKTESKWQEKNSREERKTSGLCGAMRRLEPFNSPSVSVSCCCAFVNLKIVFLIFVYSHSL